MVHVNYSVLEIYTCIQEKYYYGNDILAMKSSFKANILKRTNTLCFRNGMLQMSYIVIKPVH